MFFRIFAFGPFAAVALLLLPACLRADHGQNFLLLDDTDLSAPGAGHLLGTFSWEKDGGRDHFGLAPGFNVGLIPRVALSVNGSFADEGDDWSYRSVLPTLHVNLTPSDGRFPIRIGLSAGYQFADGANGEDDVVTTVEEVIYQKPVTEKRIVTVPVKDPDDGGGGGVDPGPDGPPRQRIITPKHAGHGEHETTTRTVTVTKNETVTKRVIRETRAESGGASAVHNHDDSLFTARLILEADLTPDTLFVFNLISVLPEGESNAWGYGAGLRQKITPTFSAGVEAMGDFDRGGRHQIMGAAYWTPIHHFTLKLGAGAGLTEESPDFAVRAGFVWEWH